MKRSIYRGTNFLGEFSVDEAKGKLVDGSLLPTDCVADGLGFLPVTSWLDGADASSPHSVPDQSLPSSLPQWHDEPISQQPPPKSSEIPALPPNPAPKVVSMRQVKFNRSPHWTSRRKLVLGAVAGAAGLVLTKLIVGRFRFSIDNIRRSIVRIVVRGAPGGLGTGFCIECQTHQPHASVFATASHVVSGRGLHSLTDDTDAAFIETSDGRTAELRTPFCYDARLDHCAFSSLLTIPPLPLAQKLPALGDKIYAAGFAEGEAFAVSEGFVTDYAVEEFRLVTSAKISPGFSGGPVLNEAGEVVGMTVTRSLEGPPTSSAVPLHELQNLVQRMAFITFAKAK